MTALIWHWQVLMLVTNSLKNDLNHPNQYVVGLALCSLGNIGSMDRVCPVSVRTAAAHSG